MPPLPSPRCLFGLGEALNSHLTWSVAESSRTMSKARLGHVLRQTVSAGQGSGAGRGGVSESPRSSGRGEGWAGRGGAGLGG